MIPFLEPYMAWIRLGLVAAAFGAGLYLGYAWERDAREAALAEQLAAAQQKYEQEVERNAELSGVLASAEAAIQTNYVEKIKYVDRVTTGKTCLSAAAVALVNGVPNVPFRLGKAADTWKPAAESAGSPPATDADVESYLLDAQQQYEVCAARLNRLVDVLTLN